MVSKLYLAWRGSGEERSLAWASFPERDRNPPWSVVHPLDDRASEVGPALAAFGNQLFMAWRGPADDQTLFCATFDDGQEGPAPRWSPQTRLGDRGSVLGPALAAFRDKLYMAWRGIDDDRRLYWATFPDPSRTPPWSEQHVLDDHRSFRGPALAVFEDRLFMAWRGIPGDRNLYWSTNGGSGWSPQNRLTDRGSADGPALVVFSSTLYMIWRGIETEDEGDLRLFFSRFLGGPGDGSWSPQAVLIAVDGTPIPSSSRPAVAVFWREALGDEECIIVNVGLRTAEIFPNPGGVGDDPSDPSHPQAGPDARMFFGEFDGDVTTRPSSDRLYGIATGSGRLTAIEAQPKNKQPENFRSKHGS